MIDTVRAVVERWNCSLVNYAVANGLEDYPRRLGRDVDVVVDRRHLRTASVAVREVLERRGWRVVVLAYPEVIQHVGIPPNGAESLIVDLFPGLRWGPVWLVEQPAASYDIDGFRVDPWVSFVKRVLLHVLVAPVSRFSGRPDRLALSDAEHVAASARLSRLLGTELAARFLSTVQRQDVAGLEALQPVLRRALIVSSVRESPFRALRTTAQWAAARVTFATARPVMPTVSIVGPEGIDRAPVVAEVVRQTRDRLRCSRVVVRRRRPGILPRLGKWAGTPSRAIAVPARPTAGWLGPVRTVYHALDFLLGRVLLDRRVAVDLGLVVYERCALDLCIDPVHDGPTPGRMMRRLIAALPHQDLVVLLHDQPGDIRGRKPDLDEAEIRRQLDQWTRLADRGTVHMVLHVQSDPAASAERIVDRLVNLFVRRNSGGRRPWI